MYCVVVVGLCGVVGIVVVIGCLCVGCDGIVVVNLV